MDIMLWLMAPVVLYAIAIRFFLSNIEWIETGLKAGIGCAIIGVGFMLSFFGQTSDTEVWNGKVTGKERDRVSCSHSYSCPPCWQTCSGQGSSRTCTETCSTCYDHDYDYNWEVYTTVGGVTIDRVDRQGIKEPKRWTAVIIGEPAASQHHYTNYVIGSPNSLFNLKAIEADKKRYQFPTHHRVYDYYRLKHTYAVGVNVPNLNEWDKALAEALRDLGNRKQVNINVLFVTGKSLDYGESLERTWIGGKKNDVNIVINLENNKFDWVYVFAFGKSSGNEMLQVALRDTLQEVGKLDDPVGTTAAISKEIVTHFKRPEMAKYKYLRSNIRPSTAAIVWILVLEFLFLVGFTWWTVVNDIRQYNGYGYGSRQSRSQDLLNQLRKSMFTHRRK